MWLTDTDMSKRILILMLLAFFALALFYSISVPLGEAPDEVPHFSFVRFIAEKHILPEGTEAGSEGFQPPLYYAIAALATSWIDVGDFQMRANTDFSWDTPETSKNLLLHTKAEAFPWVGGALAWHITRFLSILMGLVTIVATYLIGREIFPDRPIIALGMAAVNAFTPEFIFMSSVVNNDNLIAALSALLILKLIRILKGATAWRDFIQLGTLLGLSLIAKSSAIIFIPLALMVLFSTPANKRLSLLQSSLWSTITAIFAFGFSGWWFLRNQVLLGDPLGWSLKVSMSDIRSTPLAFKDFPWLIDGLFQSFWGRFGGAAHLRLSSSLYVALSLIVLASVAGCALALYKIAKKQRSIQSPSTTALVLAALTITLTFIALVRWTMSFLGTDQARLLYPALSALILFLILGLLEIIPARLHTSAIAGLGFALFTLAVITPFTFIRPVYSSPEPLSVAEVPAIPNQTLYDFDGEARLVGYEFDKDLYKPGEMIKLTLYWEALSEIRDDQWLQVQLVDKTGQVVFQKEGDPSGGEYSADLWHVGEIIPAEHYLRLDQAIQPGAYSLRLSMRPAPTKAWVPIFDRRIGWVGDSAAVAKVRFGSKSKSSPQGMEQTLNATAGGRFTLLGYTLRGADSLKPGGRLLLTLYWEKLPGVQVDTNYTIFTQLLDSTSHIQAQQDSQPVQGSYPTTIWEDQEIVVDEYVLAVSPQAPQGGYSLIVGMYDPANGQRLPTLDAGGNPLGDNMRLAGLEIK